MSKDEIKSWEKFTTPEELDKIKISWWEKKIYFPLWRRWHWICDIPYQIFYFYQRGRYGFSTQDVWSIDFYLCDWMPKAIRQLKKESRGHPIESKNIREWRNTLEKIARGFEAGNKLSSLDFMENETRPEVWKPNEGLTLFKKYFINLWW